MLAPEFRDIRVHGQHLLMYVQQSLIWCSSFILTRILKFQEVYKILFPFAYKKMSVQKGYAEQSILHIEVISKILFCA